MMASLGLYALVLMNKGNKIFIVFVLFTSDVILTFVYSTVHHTAAHRAKMPLVNELLFILGENLNIFRFQLGPKWDFLKSF